ncbi:hypothetical protein DMENIID0001_079480 [Sergentomyia squamirostris]
MGDIRKYCLRSRKENSTSVTTLTVKSPISLINESRSDLRKLMISQKSKTSSSAGKVTIDFALVKYPIQPDAQCIPKQVEDGQTYHFQQKLYNIHPWLQYSDSTKGFCCYYCLKALERGLISKNHHTIQYALQHSDLLNGISTGLENIEATNGLQLGLQSRSIEHVLWFLRELFRRCIAWCGGHFVPASERIRDEFLMDALTLWAWMEK